MTAAGVAGWLAYVAADNTVNLTWQRIVAKLTITTAFGLVGTYLATQSGEHRHQERLARRRHLDLLALPLFIAKLDDKDQTSIVTKLAEQGFLTPEAVPPVKGPRKGVSLDQLPELVTALRNGK